MFQSKLVVQLMNSRCAEQTITAGLILTFEINSTQEGRRLANDEADLVFGSFPFRVQFGGLSSVCREKWSYNFVHSSG